MQETCATVLPWRDEPTVKEYLLQAKERPCYLQQLGGTAHAVCGIAGLQQLLGDRQFVCLHYRLLPDGKLQPCVRMPGHEAEGGSR